MLDNLPANTLPRLLRRTNLFAIVVGIVGFFVAVFVAPPLAALGVALGVALAIVNFRQLIRQSTKVELRGEQPGKVVRRQIGSRTTVRLAAVTALVILILFLNAPLAIGIVTGLVLYQIVFVLSVVRIVAGQGGVQ